MTDIEAARTELVEFLGSEEGRRLVASARGVVEQAKWFQDLCTQMPSKIARSDDLGLTIGAFGLEIQEIIKHLEGPYVLNDKFLEIGRKHGVVNW